ELLHFGQDHLHDRPLVARRVRTRRGDQPRGKPEQLVPVAVNPIEQHLHTALQFGHGGATIDRGQTQNPDGPRLPSLGLYGSPVPATAFRASPPTAPTPTPFLPPPPPRPPPPPALP